MEVFTSNNLETSSLAPKKHMSVPKPVVSGIFKAEQYKIFNEEKSFMSLPSLESTTIEEIFLLLLTLMEHSEK